MVHPRLTWLVLLSGCLDGGGQGSTADTGDAGVPASGSPDLAGFGDTDFTAGNDPTNPFFASLGKNDRTCASCHEAASGWTVTPASLQARFTETAGADPIFRPVDGATSPTADVSTPAARQTAYALLLARGLIRVERPLPANAEFALTAVDDPYGHASAAGLSLFRRPLPATNLRFASVLMWDGREPTLAQQAMDATTGHAEAAAATAAELAPAVAFESGLYTAQSFDATIGDLSAGAGGGPIALATQPLQPTGRQFDLYAGWANAGGRRAAIARGEQIFTTERFQIRGVAGIPDQQGTCTTCHSTSNAGGGAPGLLVDLGISDANRRSADLPLYTLTNLADGRVIRTSDPGLALSTGRWADIGRFKVPTLRAVVMRPPYFHDGFAPSLGAVVQFYTQRFGLRLSPQERGDLIAFLEAL